MVPPRLDTSIFAGICELGPRPLVVTGWFRIWLTNHFQVDKLEDQTTSIQKMLWSPEATTGILIESISAWRPELVEKRPAVIIARGDWRRIRVGIGDKISFGSPEPDFTDAYANLWQCSHTLFCIAGHGSETEKLAAEVFRELNEFGPAVRATLELKRFEVVSVGKMMILDDEARQNYVVPVTVAYVYEESWKLRRETSPLKKIDLAVFQP